MVSLKETRAESVLLTLTGWKGEGLSNLGEEIKKFPGFTEKTKFGVIGDPDRPLVYGYSPDQLAGMLKRWETEGERKSFSFTQPHAELAALEAVHQMIGPQDKLVEQAFQSRTAELRGSLANHYTGIHGYDGQVLSNETRRPKKSSGVAGSVALDAIKNTLSEIGEVVTAVRKRPAILLPLLTIACAGGVRIGTGTIPAPTEGPAPTVEPVESPIELTVTRAQEAIKKWESFVWGSESVVKIGEAKPFVDPEDLSGKRLWVLHPINGVGGIDKTVSYGFVPGVRMKTAGGVEYDLPFLVVHDSKIQTVEALGLVEDAVYTTSKRNVFFMTERGPDGRLIFSSERLAIDKLDNGNFVYSLTDEFGNVITYLTREFPEGVAQAEPTEVSPDEFNVVFHAGSVPFMPSPIPRTETPIPIVVQDKVEIVDEASVPAEVVAAWKSLNLETAKDYRWGQNAEWGWVLVDKEGRIKFVDYPMTFSLDGKETVVHMPLQFTQTTGEGNMVVMTALRASDETKVGREITGTDTQAREFYAWLLEYYKDREGTEFYENLQRAANGQMDVEFIRADLNLIPKDWLAKRQTNVVRMNGASLNYIMKDGQDVIHVVTIEPHVFNGKLVFVDFSDISLTTNAENPDTLLTSESWIGGVVARSLGDVDGLVKLGQLVQQELENLHLLIDKVVIE